MGLSAAFSKAFKNIKMDKIPELFNNFKANMFAKYANDNSKLLVHTAAFAWGLAALANGMGVIFNKKIDKKQKKYLVAQEIADGVTNIGLFVFITKNLIKGTEFLVNKGYLSSKLLAGNEAGQELFKEGAKTIASVVGAVACNNILTPIIRNKVATIVQKRMSKKEIALAKEAVPIPSSIQYSGSLKQQPLTISNFMKLTRSSGNLKI